MLTPDDLMAGARPDGERVLLFDDDHYYMGGVLAELLAREGRQVTLVTPANCVSSWTAATMEQHRIQRRLLELGSRSSRRTRSSGPSLDSVRAVCTFTERERELPADAVVMVTARLPVDDVYQELVGCGRAGRTRGCGRSRRSATVWPRHHGGGGLGGPAVRRGARCR